jgi:hypothetical protein
LGLLRFHPSRHDPNCGTRDVTLGPTRSNSLARLSSCWSISLTMSTLAGQTFRHKRGAIPAPRPRARCR